MIISKDRQLRRLGVYTLTPPMFARAALPPCRKRRSLNDVLRFLLASFSCCISSALVTCVLPFLLALSAYHALSSFPPLTITTPYSHSSSWCSIYPCAYVYIYGCRSSRPAMCLTVALLSLRPYTHTRPRFSRYRNKRSSLSEGKPAVDEAVRPQWQYFSNVLIKK